MLGDYVSAELVRGSNIVDLIFNLTGGRGFIAGGFARYCLSQLNNPIIPDDIDIFCVDEDNFNDIVVKFKNNPLIKQKSASEIEHKFEYRITDGFNRSVYRIQVIRPTQIMNMITDGNFFRVLDNFDFTIAKCVITPDHCYVHRDFHQNDNNRELVITNIHCPISSAKRVIKYCSRGFTITSNELLKLFVDYENRTPEWKRLINDGLSGTLDPDNQDEFTKAMYLD